MMFFKAVDEIGRHPREPGAGPKVFAHTRNLSMTPADQVWAKWEGGSLGRTGVELWKVHSTGHAIDLQGADRASFHLPVRGRMALTFRKDEMAAPAGQGALLGIEPRRTHVIAPAGETFEAMVVLLPWKRIASLDPDQRLPSVLGIVPPGMDEALHGFVRLAFAELSKPGSGLARSARARTTAAILLTELYHELFVRALDSPQPRPAGLRQVAEAEAMMRARFNSPLSMSDLAAEVGVGHRALQLAFARYRGTTLRAELQRIRLEAARASLLAPQPGDTVTSVAFECGFVHLGRFSEAYGRAFGELPSQTLRRNRAFRGV